MVTPSKDSEDIGVQNAPQYTGILSMQTKNDLPFGFGFSDVEDIWGSITAPYCQESEIRSCGFWKNHEEVSVPYFPITLGWDFVANVEEAAEILKACGNCAPDCDDSMRGKFKAQLLAMKLNLAHFEPCNYFVESEGKTIVVLVNTDNGSTGITVTHSIKK